MDQQPQDVQSTPPQQQPVTPVTTPVTTPVSAPVQQPTGNGFAITALILGILAFLTGWMSILSFVTSIPAVVFGSLALSKHQSKGMAVTGLVLAGLSILFVVGVLIFAAMNPGAIKTTLRAN